MRVRRRFIHAALALALVGATLAEAAPRATAADELIYVKKSTRRATRDASLAASRATAFPDTWHLIGPFANEGNRGFATAYPPELAIDLEAEYPGSDGPVRWQLVELPDGEVHALDRFDSNDERLCYLYRRVESPVARRVHVSLGSDDGLVVWLNGRELLRVDETRAAAADQNFVTLDLVEGLNHLLLKVANRAGPWAFYFNPTLSGNLLVKLERQLARDFPRTREDAHYRIEPLPLPEGSSIEVGALAFLPDGRLAVGTRRGEIWLVSGATSDDVDAIHWHRFAQGLHEILGFTVVDERTLLVGQRPEVTLVRDNDGDGAADEFLTVCDRFGISGDYHEYLYGPVRDAEGNLYIALNVGFGGGHQSRVPYRGCCLRIAPDGTMQPWAYGLRSPNGLNFAPDGRLYFTDNQGEWVAACKLQEVRYGEFYGHVASARWWPGVDEERPPEPVPPAIWFPFWVSRSTSEPVWDQTAGAFGPFAGQCFVGCQGNSLIMRVALEEVQGRMQGACFLFRQGFRSGVNRLAFAPDGSLLAGETNRGWGSIGGASEGLERLVYTGSVPFEVHSIRVTPEGWDLTFTEPVDPAMASDPASYQWQSYTYHYWGTYGSPPIDERKHEVTGVRVADDGRSVSLSMPDRETGRIYRLEMSGLTSSAGGELLHPRAWYTLNALP